MGVIPYECPEMFWAYSGPNMRSRVSVLFLTVFAAATANAAVTMSVICTETFDNAARLNTISGKLTAPVCKVSEGFMPSALASASFSNDVNITGWADLRVYAAAPSGEQVTALRFQRIKAANRKVS